MKSMAHLVLLSVIALSGIVRRGGRWRVSIVLQTFSHRAFRNREAANKFLLYCGLVCAFSHRAFRNREAAPFVAASLPDRQLSVIALSGIVRRNLGFRKPFTFECLSVIALSGIVRRPR